MSEINKITESLIVINDAISFIFHQQPTIKPLKDMTKYILIYISIE